MRSDKEKKAFYKGIQPEDILFHALSYGAKLRKQQS